MTEEELLKCIPSRMLLAKGATLEAVKTYFLTGNQNIANISKIHGIGRKNVNSAVVRIRQKVEQDFVFIGGWIKKKNVEEIRQIIDIS